MVLPKSKFGPAKAIQGPSFACCVPMSMAKLPSMQMRNHIEFHSATTQYSQLRLVTDQELLDSYQRLHTRSSSCTKKAFAQWQQATGLTYSRHALMLNQPLLENGIIRPATQFCHDWMHGVLQGTAPCVLYHLFTSLATECFDCYGFFEKYFQCWEYPKAGKQATFTNCLKRRKWKNPRMPENSAAQQQSVWPYTL